MLIQVTVYFTRNSCSVWTADVLGRLTWMMRNDINEREATRWKHSVRMKEMEETKEMKVNFLKESLGPGPAEPNQVALPSMLQPSWCSPKPWRRAFKSWPSPAQPRCPTSMKWFNTTRLDGSGRCIEGVKGRGPK